MKTVTFKESGKIDKTWFKGVHKDIPADAIDIDSDLCDTLFNNNALRYIDKAVVDISSRTSFYIDENGEKDTHGDGQHLECAYLDNLIYKNSAWAVQGDADLTERVIKQYIVRIDDLASNLYTSSPRQSAVYISKYRDALAYKALNYPIPVPIELSSYLVLEAAEKGLTSEQLADAIIQRADSLNLAGGQIELYRTRLASTVTAVKGQEAKEAEAELVMIDLKSILD